MLRIWDNNSWWRYVAYAAFGLLVITCIALVYVRHVTRNQLAQLQTVHSSRDKLHNEWTRLTLEYQALTNYNRINALAERHLKMRAVANNDLIILKSNDSQ